MSRVRFAVITLVLAGLLGGLAEPVAAEPITVGGYPFRAEGLFTSSAPTYVARLTLPKQRRLVVEVASQYVMDFGIIPAQDVKEWRKNENPKFLFRLTGQTDTRYINLPAGEYAIVARDINAGIVTNGFAVKIRNFSGKAKDNGDTLQFLSNEVSSENIGIRTFNGIILPISTTAKMWVEGVYARGADQNVTWELLTTAEYRKFLAGLSYSRVMSGSDPKTFGFHFVPEAGTDYYLIFINQGLTVSSFTVTQELYR